MPSKDVENQIYNLNDIRTTTQINFFMKLQAIFD